MINKRVSFHFLFHKPISKVWAKEGSSLFIKLKNEKHSMLDRSVESDDVTISFSECYWKVYQGDNLVIDNNSHPEVIEDFATELIGLKIEEVMFLSRDRSWLFLLFDGTHIYAEFKSDLQKCLIDTSKKHYSLRRFEDVSVEEKSI